MALHFQQLFVALPVVASALESAAGVAADQFRGDVFKVALRVDALKVAAFDDGVADGGTLVAVFESNREVILEPTAMAHSLALFHRRGLRRCCRGRPRLVEHA